MREIHLSRGYVAKVDDDDARLAMSVRWRVTKGKGCYYAVGRHEKKTVLMHRFLLGITDPKTDVDHRDGDGLNNQRSNLRPCTRSQNLSNRGKSIKNTSGFKGVTAINSKNGKRYVAVIGHNYKRVHIGVCATPEEAARAYDEAAKKYHGEFARLNFPEAAYSPQTD